MGIVVVQTSGIYLKSPSHDSRTNWFAVFDSANSAETFMRKWEVP